MVGARRNGGKGGRGRDPYVSAAAAAFVLLGVGYLVREQGSFGPGLALALGVLPNFAGCVAVPLIVAPILRRRRHSALSSRGTTALLGAAIGLIGSFAIEILHGIADLGVYDPNDAVASVVGSTVGVAIVLAIDGRAGAERPSHEVAKRVR